MRLSQPSAMAIEETNDGYDDTVEGSGIEVCEAGRGTRKKDCVFGESIRTTARTLAQSRLYDALGNQSDICNRLTNDPDRIPPLSLGHHPLGLDCGYRRGIAPFSLSHPFIASRGDHRSR